MENTPLRQFLQNICCNSPWKYAAFWKLQHQDQMLLTLEEYCHTSKQRNSVKENICSKGSDERVSSKPELKIYDGNLDTDPVELALCNMSRVQYVFGEGVIGEVACSGNHCWFFSDDILAGEYGSQLVAQCPEDWIYQLVAGIETIILVPVLPHGVLQLGSLEKVAEDLALVGNTKDRFLSFQEGFSVPLLADMHFTAHSASAMMSNVVENELLGLVMNEIKSDAHIDVSSAKQTCHVLSNMTRMTPPNEGKNLQKTSGEDVPKMPSGSTGKNVNVQFIGLMEEQASPETFCRAFDCSLLKTTENSLFGYSCIKEKSQAQTHHYEHNMGAYGDYAIGTMKFDNDTDMKFDNDTGMISQWLVGGDAANSFFSFPRDCELHKALGPAITGRPDFLEIPEEYNNSNLIGNGHLDYCSESTVCEARGSFIEGNDSKHLLGSVVTNVNRTLDKKSDRTMNVKSSMTSHEHFSAFSEKQRQSQRCSLVVEDETLQSCMTSAYVDKGGNAQSASSYESVRCSVAEEQPGKVHHFPHTRKGSKLSSDSRKRSRTDDSKKQRPRDRQLIQDRLKELRDLVPNGVKCSIDGLLDRTIKHMLFLRSITDQADRLKCLVQEEVAEGEKLKSPERKDGEQNGSSWAFELGSEQQLCPIIVKDLEFPGHKLIEMLCNDHGRFIEIAEVIRRLDLSILKGVMENRSGSTCAQFVVEVPRGFHRLDIFWPLMQLLQ